ncbi:hypothetical protein J6590_042639 [Homalodisca vitripennis]|nr:hypothetical protein J6590_042639 [Homalodisca vitripennis]
MKFRSVYKNDSGMFPRAGVRSANTLSNIETLGTSSYTNLKEAAKLHLAECQARVSRRLTHLRRKPSHVGGICIYLPVFYEYTGVWKLIA